MNHIFIAFFVFAALFCGARADRGVIQNCGDAAHNFDGWFEPNPIVVNQNLTVQVSFVPAAGVTQNLNAQISVKFEGINIYNGNQKVPCSMLPVCPIEAGKQVVELVTVPLTYQIPRGHYIIKANITNDDGVQLLCGIVDTHIVHLDPKHPRLIEPIHH